MSTAPKVIHIHGRARVAYDQGFRVERQDQIYVPSEKSWFYTVDTSDHFVYRQDRHMGSSLMCSCGATAGIYNYDVYSRFTTINKGRMICCNSLMQTNRHADGSNG